MNHSFKIFLTAFLVLLLSDSVAMASGKPPRKIGGNWEDRSAATKRFSEAPSARGAPLGSGKKMPEIREQEDDSFTEIQDSVSTMAYEQTSATIFDDKDLKKHIKRLYLEVRPTNYELLYGHASSFISKGLFNRFDQGVAIHWPGSMPFDEEKISDVLGSLKSATKFRVSIEGGVSDERSLEFIWDCLQGLVKIQEMDLSGCGLTHGGVEYVMDSVGNPKGLTRLDLRGNHLTAEIAPVIRKRFPKLKVLEMDEMGRASQGWFGKFFGWGNAAPIEPSLKTVQKDPVVPRQSTSGSKMREALDSLGKLKPLTTDESSVLKGVPRGALVRPGAAVDLKSAGLKRGLLNGP